MTGTALVYGIALAGERNPAKLAKYSLGVALAIEAFAITWAKWRMPK